jgi:hypothetical protein
VIISWLGSGGQSGGLNPLYQTGGLGSVQLALELQSLSNRILQVVRIAASQSEKATDQHHAIEAAFIKSSLRREGWAE